MKVQKAKVQKLDVKESDIFGASALEADDYKLISIVPTTDAKGKVKKVVTGVKVIDEKVVNLSELSDYEKKGYKITSTFEVEEEPEKKKGGK